ncbi:Gamma-tubulin complex component 6 [Brachionus plicatilis]|uniref:Gamma-tubulin complex component n=1 Tax=Brachionus plicatilis TaxID=10195 RepID=A0A3M7S5A1_BRAPC|nr:Gamma-tubulin complex component 6 [Brachionus plicatilis]
MYPIKKLNIKESLHKNLLCTSKKFHPKLKVDFNEDYLNQIEDSCSKYADFVRNNSKYKLKSRREYLELEQQKQEEYLRRLQNEAFERFKQYEQQEAENRLLEIEAKQKRFNFLKKQMEEELKRRQEEKEREKQKDREYMDTLVNRNSQFQQEKHRLEEQLKIEIKQEYEEKMSEAEQREKDARRKIEQTVNKIKHLDESAMDVDMEEAEIDQEKVIDESDVEMEVVVDTPVKPKISDQTTQKDYRSSIKLNDQVNSLTQSPGQMYKPKSPAQQSKSSVKMSQNFHVSKQSDFLDLEQKDKQRLEWLKSRAVHGHASDSKIQNMLKHNDLLSSLDEQAMFRAKLFDHFTKKEDRVEQINFDEIIQPYQERFPRLDKPLELNLLTNLSYVSDDDLCFEEKKYQPSDSAQSHSFRFVDLEEILSRILYRPVQVQLKLVNKSCINYFLFDLRLEDHLQALRKYVLFENGVFAQKFVDELMLKVEDMHYNGHFVDLEFLLSPIFIKEAFAKTCSLFKNCQFISNLLIRLKSKINNSKTSRLLNYLDMIELAYEAQWPLNIIINQTNLNFYNEIFGFLLKIKFVLSALNNIWQTLRRYELKKY